MSAKVAVISASQTKFGEHWDQSLRRLGSQPVIEDKNGVDKGI